MSFRSFLRIAALFLIVTSDPFAFAQQDRRGRKYKAPPATMKVDILVVRATNGKPIPNAAVIFHPVNEKGKIEGRDGVEDRPGREDGAGCDSDRVDGAAAGDCERLPDLRQRLFANADAKQITIRMKKPGQQYSIYKGNATGDQSGQAQETTEKPETSKPE